MNRKTKTCFRALLVFILVGSTLQSQSLGKSPGSAPKTGTTPGSFTQGAKVAEPAGDKGAKVNPATRPETSRWAGYTSNPFGPYKWHVNQLELTEEDGGQISGKYHVGVAGRLENYLTKIKGERRGKALRFMDMGVLHKTPVPPNSGPWYINRSCIATFGPYGALLGEWLDPTRGLAAKGQIFFVRMDYHIVIQRQQQEADGMTRSTLFLNGTALGDVYENTNELIPDGVYPGRRLFVAPNNIVQGRERRLGTSGDFLLEIAKVPNRKNVLILPGDKAAKVGDGVLAGAAIKQGDAWVAPPMLAALRWHFYGTDNSVPLDPLYLQKERNIRIEVRDAPQGAVPLPAMKVDESSLAAPLTRPIRVLEPSSLAPKK